MSKRPDQHDKIDTGPAPEVDTAGSQDVTADERPADNASELGTPASSDPEQMADVSPDELGGTGGPDAGGAG